MYALVVGNLIVMGNAMIDEHGYKYWFLSCDICGIAEEGPFEDFYEAVQFKKDNPNDWKSLNLKDERMGKWKLHDVCADCVPKTTASKWKTIPTSKRPKKVSRENDLTLGKDNPIRYNKGKTLADIAERISASIGDRAALSKPPIQIGRGD